MPFRHRRPPLSRLASAGAPPSPGWVASASSKTFESAATMLGTGVVLGLAGYSYHRYYKWLILHKMERAFRPGDPALEIAGPATSSSTTTSAEARHEHVDEYDNEHQLEGTLRPEQARLDAIVTGAERGRYYLLIGEKGTGKSSMLLEAMRKVDGEGISMFEAHADLEVFRVRLGKALDYEYHEDYIGALFSIRGPRDTTALLDIERAFNKLEKIALERRNTRQRKHRHGDDRQQSVWSKIASALPWSVRPHVHGHGPLILIVNCTHLIRDDEDGRDLLELMQQRAEQWTASNLVTMVFNSDDYWVYERLKRYATRMEVIPILDLPKEHAISVLAQYRQKCFPHQRSSSEILDRVYDRVGGRLTFLSSVAKTEDMLQACEKICTTEKTWFLNRCGILGESMDDDVMDQQKYASAAMVLAKALVALEKDMEITYDPTKGHILPQIPLYKAREIMTRADFIQAYDSENLFTIDSNAMVRADSVPMMNAFREICAEEGFDEYLQATLDRISAIESLNRTRELTLKDLWIEQAGEQRGSYKIVTKDARGKDIGIVEFSMKPNTDEV
jgi:hypothetical protein